MGDQEGGIGMWGVFVEVPCRFGWGIRREG